MTVTNAIQQKRKNGQKVRTKKNAATIDAMTANNKESEIDATKSMCTISTIATQVAKMRVRTTAKLWTKTRTSQG